MSERLRAKQAMNQAGELFDCIKALKTEEYIRSIFDLEPDPVGLDGYYPRWYRSGIGIYLPNRSDQADAIWAIRPGTKMPAYKSRAENMPLGDVTIKDQSNIADSGIIAEIALVRDMDKSGIVSLSQRAVVLSEDPSRSSEEDRFKTVIIQNPEGGGDFRVVDQVWGPEMFADTVEEAIDVASAAVKPAVQDAQRHGQYLMNLSANVLGQ